MVGEGMEEEEEEKGEEKEEKEEEEEEEGVDWASVLGSFCSFAPSAGPLVQTDPPSAM